MRDKKNYERIQEKIQKLMYDAENKLKEERKKILVSDGWSQRGVQRGLKDQYERRMREL